VLTRHALADSARRGGHVDHSSRRCVLARDALALPPIAPLLADRTRDDRRDEDRDAERDDHFVPLHFWHFPGSSLCEDVTASARQFPHRQIECVFETVSPVGSLPMQVRDLPCRSTQSTSSNFVATVSSSRT
jgi:hypothetical protein